MGKRRHEFLKFSLVVLLFLGLTVVWLGFGKRGFIHLYQMQKERQSTLERIHKLEKENQKLLDEIERLRTDGDYVESVARMELGLVRDNEILYRFSRREKGIE